MHKQYCMNCGHEVDINSAICLNCNSHACGGDNYCKYCGGAVENFECAKCGSVNTATHPYSKSKKKAAALAFTLGAFGAHDIYLGRKSVAIKKISVTLLINIINLLIQLSLSEVSEYSSVLCVLGTLIMVCSGFADAGRIIFGEERHSRDIAGNPLL